VHLISPLKHTPRCLSHVRLTEHENIQPTDAVLYGDDQGNVTLMSLDIKDLSESRNDVELGFSATRQERRIIHIDPKTLTL